MNTPATAQPALTILYRGPLADCNYRCPYCPFAKRREGRPALRADRLALERFVDWCARWTGDTLAVFFTPWGEALTHAWYRAAMVRLSHLPHVTRVAAQTNLSRGVDWAAAADPARIAFWATYHPGSADRGRFLARCRRLSGLGTSYSVGIVGLKEHLDAMEALRRELPPAVYLWVNAYRHEARYYDIGDLARITAVDPLFHYNLAPHRSLGQPCRTGHTVIAVDGAGAIRRCHWVREPLGNIYEEGWSQNLKPAPCPNQNCGCHIGYVHLESLRLDEVFGPGLLERIPISF